MLWTSSGLFKIEIIFHEIGQNIEVEQKMNVIIKFLFIIPGFIIKVIFKWDFVLEVFIVVVCIRKQQSANSV